jgi:hypothetical protein
VEHRRAKAMKCRTAKQKRRVAFVIIHSGSAYGDLADHPKSTSPLINVPVNPKKVFGWVEKTLRSLDNPFGPEV